MTSTPAPSTPAASAATPSTATVSTAPAASLSPELQHLLTQLHQLGIPGLGVARPTASRLDGQPIIINYGVIGKGSQQNVQINTGTGKEKVIQKISGDLKSPKGQKLQNDKEKDKER
jgi:hypothetical protein